MLVPILSNLFFFLFLSFIKMSFELLDETFTPVAYEQSSIVNHWHNAPRFFPSSDANFSNIASNDRTIVDGYVLGASAIAFVLFFAFIVWLLIVFVLFCLYGGKSKNHSNINNSASRVNELSIEEVNEYNVNRNQNEKVDKIENEERKWTFLHILPALCGLLGALGILLYVSIGLPAAKDALDSFSNANALIGDILKEVLADVQSMNSIGVQAISLRDSLIQSLDATSFCPNSEVVKQVYGIDFQSMTDDLVTSLNNLNNFIDTQSAELVANINRAIKANNDIGDGLNFVEDNYMVAGFIMIAILILFLFCGVFWTKCLCPSLYFVQVASCALLPIVWIIILLCMIVAAVFSILSIMTADFCSGTGNQGLAASPSNSILAVMNEQGISQNSYYYQGVEFYLVNQCQDDFPFSFLTKYFTDIDDGVLTSNEFTSTVDMVGVSNLSEVCGSNSNIISNTVSDLLSFQENTLVELNSLLTSVIGSNGLLTCTRLLPIYYEAVYDGSCSEGMQAWNASFYLSISLMLFGMIMLCVRVSIGSKE